MAVKLRFGNGHADASWRKQTPGPLPPTGPKGSVSCTAIRSDNVARTPLRRELRMTSFAATALEHKLIFEKLRRDWRNPTEKLLLVPLIRLREMLPLPTEAFGRCGFVAGDAFDRSKARHAPNNGPSRGARRARKLSFNDLCAIAPPNISDLNGACAHWTAKILE
jgi:hypothetical protein